MPDSPASFGAWDDALDREILAERLPCDEFDAALLAEHLRIAQVSIWTYVARGKIPAPDHYEESRAIWKAEQLVGAL